MVEISTFPNGVETLNGNHLEPEIEVAPYAHYDAERGVFVASNGNEVELSGNPVNKLILERITNEGKPKIPMIEVTILGKHKQMQANPNDPGYLALLDEWNTDRGIKIAKYLINIGIKNQPPQEFMDEQRQYCPDATPSDMKYFWMGSVVPEGDFDVLIDTIIGQSQPTAKGLEEAANFSTSK